MPPMHMKNCSTPCWHPKHLRLSMHYNIWCGGVPPFELGLAHAWGTASSTMCRLSAQDLAIFIWLSAFTFMENAWMIQKHLNECCVMNECCVIPQPLCYRKGQVGTSYASIHFVRLQRRAGVSVKRRRHCPRVKRTPLGFCKRKYSREWL